MASILKSCEREFKEDLNKIDNFRLFSDVSRVNYLDVRFFIGHDICEYPDSNKIFIVPTYEIFKKDSLAGYFDGEENIQEKWKEIQQ